MAAAEGTGVGNVLALERLRDARAGTEQSRFPLARPMHRQRLAHPADADARGQLLYLLRPPGAWALPSTSTSQNGLKGTNSHSRRGAESPGSP